MTYYRYEDGINYDEGIEIRLLDFEVIKETPCGKWIKFPNRDKYLYSPIKYIQGKKFILEQSTWYKTITKKRFAWPTKKEALDSYIHRKTYQIGMLEYKLENAKTFLAKAKEIQNDSSFSN